MCEKSSRERLAVMADANISDATVGKLLAEDFVKLYTPSATADYKVRAEADITDTLANVIPGCLTGNECLDEDIQALLFAQVAARHEWVKRD